MDGAAIPVHVLAGKQMGDDQGKTPYKAAKGLRILVVEDHDDTRRVLTHLLAHFGHDVSMADGARSALEIIETKNFDVVLCDIGLPDGSGHDVISHAKRKQPLKGVALTGFDKEEDIERSKKAGFDFHLTKPVDFHELRTVLGQLSS
jgi:CheY-like chemotaxis protein